MKLAAYEAENTAVARPVTPGYLEYETIINQLFADIRNGGNVDDSVESAIQSIQDYMKKYQISKEKKKCFIIKRGYDHEMEKLEEEHDTIWFPFTCFCFDRSI